MKKFRPSGITAKMLAIIIPVVLLVLILFGREVNSLYGERLTQAFTAQMQTQLDSVASQIDSTLGEINRLSLYACSLTTLRNRLAKALLVPDRFTNTNRIELYSEVIAPMMNLINRPGKYKLVLYPLSDRVFIDYKFLMPLSSLPEEIDIEPLLTGNYSNPVYSTVRTTLSYDTPQETICITRVITYINGTPLAVLNTFIAADLLKEAFSAILPEEEDYSFRCELEDGQILFAQTGIEDPVDGITLKADLTSIHGAALIYSTSASIRDFIRSQTVTMYFFALSVLIIAAGMISLIIFWVMRRLHWVLERFSRLRPGQILEGEALSGSDEAALLDQTFTRIYRDYRQMVASRQEAQEKQRMLEVNLLLSRINPHFLYNTLSALRWSLPEDRWGTIDSLVAFYRGMLAKGREIASLQDELTLMDNYLELQKYTYSRRISYTRHMDSDTAGLFIPKFLLQPVFENAMKYSNVQDEVVISLDARREGDYLILQIENNGEPIDEGTRCQLNMLNHLDNEALIQARFDQNDLHGYGIFNVIQRIHLFYGRDCGLWHERPAGGGTLAKFILRACERPDEIVKKAEEHDNSAQ